MEATFSLWHLLVGALVGILVVVNTPVLLGGVSAVEAGKHRIGWTRYGWSYQYDRHNQGVYIQALGADGIGRLAPLSYTKSGLWPWYRPSRGG